mmetsp:Transcript_19114/g.44395  ORF Transcript_19114/g.44395 Transcript_19114/m.44395 type:complete len:760 (-) Transcript_19114:511-2790(-)
MHSDREYIIGLDRRKSALESSYSRPLPQRDKPIHPSHSGPVEIPPRGVAMTATTGYGGFEAQNGKSGNKNNRTRFSTLSRSGALLYPHLAIFFLVAANLLPSVVRAQAQNGTIAVTVPPDTLETIIPGATVAPLTINATNSSIPTPPPTPNPTTSPTFFPTASPTVSIKPSGTPSAQPSPAPSRSPAPTRTPSWQPTMQPSISTPIMKETKFRQEFTVGNGREFNEEDIFVFETLYQRYTTEYSPLDATEVAAKIETKCTVDKQIFLDGGSERMLKYDIASNPTNLRWRNLQETAITVTGEQLIVDYTMKYTSQYYNVTTYPKLFQNWTNSNLDVLLLQMESLKLNVTQIDSAKRIIVSTQAPTASFAPSDVPTWSPTASPEPTEMKVMVEPIDEPSVNIPPDPQEQKEFNNTLIIILPSLVIAFSILGFGVFFWCKKRREDQSHDFGSTSSKNNRSQGGSQLHSGMRWSGTNPGAVPNPSYGTSETKAYGSSFGRATDLPSGLGNGTTSPPASLVSSQSMISKGSSMGGDSREESDAANELLDEFDQYKDQNLEKMRAEIENLPDCNGMMSQAVAKALIDQHDEAITSSSYWGGDDEITAQEIEASALGFVFDWLKRNGKVTDRERKEMMQEQLNKMIASVVQKLIGPEDATRTIHEIAVLLELKLASDLSVATILISGMRKKATAADIRKTFRFFGDVVTAAIAPNEKGFGILRFNSSSAVKRAMGKFRSAEIVVEDVAVHLFLIKANAAGSRENIT